MVHKISRGVKLKVFDLWQCYRQMQAQASRMSALAGDGGGDSASMVVGGHLAPAISHATAAEGNVLCCSALQAKPTDSFYSNHILQSLVFIRIHIFPKTKVAANKSEHNF